MIHPELHKVGQKTTCNAEYIIHMYPCQQVNNTCQMLKKSQTCTSLVFSVYTDERGKVSVVYTHAKGTKHIAQETLKLRLSA